MAPLLGCLLLLLLTLQDFHLDVVSSEEASLSEEVDFVVDFCLGDGHVVFVLVEVRIGRVVVLVLKVLETLLLVEGGKQFSVPNLQFDDVEGELGQIGEGLDVAPFDQLLLLIFS